MTINYTTAGGQVRLLISDVNEESLTLTDDMIAGFLSMHGIQEATSPVISVRRGSLYRAAADALDSIATSEVLVSKVIRTGDGLTTDGAKVSDALRKRADSLRQQANRADQEEDSFFGVVEFAPYPVGNEAAERGLL